VFQANDTQKADAEQFIMAFDSDLAPVVGQQVTDDGTTDTGVFDRIGDFRTAAAASYDSQVLGPGATQCDLIVKGTHAGEERGWLFDPVAGDYASDRAGDAPFSQAALDAIADAAGQALTYTCAPSGSGVRMGIDEDEDGVLDRDELDLKTDPANAGSAPGACADGIDNDGDGLTDFAGGDLGCKDAAWDVENPQCSNGRNDDTDGLVDAADPQCAGVPHRKLEKATGCGLGGELSPLLLALAVLRRRRTQGA